MTVLDASVLISFFGTDVHSAAAADILARAAAAPSLHPVTLAEVLAGPAALGAEEDALSAIEEIGVLLAVPDDGEPLLVARLRASTRLKLPDCYPLAAALREEHSLATFDTRLAAAARRLGVEVVGA